MSTPITPKATASSALPSQPALSEGERLIDTFIAPTKTFSDLNRKSSWWVPFVLISLLSYVYVFAVDKKVGFETVSQNQMKMNPKAMEQIEKLPPDQQQRRMEMGAKFTKIISYCFPAIFLLIAVIIAGLLLAIFNFGMGAEISFGKMMAVTMYGFLPGLIQTVLIVVTLFAGANSENFIFQNPIGTNIGYYLSFSDTPRFFYSLASSLDLFTLWKIVLMGIGVSCVSKVNRNRAIITVFVAWFVWILVAAGGASLFS